MSGASDLESIDRLLAQICRMHYSRARELLHGIGLYRGQPPLLETLHEQEGLTHTELAARLGVVPATVTRMLQRMEKAGFVVRQPDPEDQRISRVYLTDAGREIRAEMRALLRSLAADTFAGFTAEERVLLRSLAADTFAGFTLEERVLLRRLLLQVHDNLARVAE